MNTIPQSDNSEPGSSVCTGTVVSVSSDSIVVQMQGLENCSACGVAGSCSGSDQSRRVTVPLGEGMHFEPGEEVRVLQVPGKSILAAVLVFVVPVIFICIGIALAMALAWNEAAGAGLGFGLIVLYFLLLVPFRKKLDTHFTMKVLPAETNGLPVDEGVYR